MQRDISSVNFRSINKVGMKNISVFPQMTFAEFNELSRSDDDYTGLLPIDILPDEVVKMIFY